MPPIFNSDKVRNFILGFRTLPEKDIQAVLDQQDEINKQAILEQYNALTVQLKVLQEKMTKLKIEKPK
jgi:hypothetical protein